MKFTDESGGDFTPSAESLFPEVIRTEALTLRRLHSETAPLRQLHDLFSENITRHLLTAPHDTLKETVDYVEHLEQQWNEDEIASYVIEIAESGEFAGMALISFEWERRVADWGIVLRERFWGEGYNAERAAAFAELAFEKLDIAVVEVSCLAENARAKRAIEKRTDDIGGHYVGLLHNARTTADGTPVDVHRFTITREEYHDSPAYSRR